MVALLNLAYSNLMPDFDISQWFTLVIYVGFR